jgi:hypothetical protein
MAFSFRDREAHRSGAPPRFALVSDCDIDADALTVSRLGPVAA